MGVVLTHVLMNSAANLKPSAMTTHARQDLCGCLIRHAEQLLALHDSVVPRKQNVKTSLVAEDSCSNLVTTTMMMIMMTVVRTSMVVGPQSAPRGSAVRRRQHVQTINAQWAT